MDGMNPEIKLGDIVRLRKPHPCGGSEWQIVRVGVDIGLVCQVCKHRIMIPRSKFNKQFKAFVAPPAP